MKSFSKQAVPRATQSAWLDPNFDNLFRREMNFAAESPSVPGFEPGAAYQWIHKNNIQNHFYKALAMFAPVFPVYSYQGVVSSWASPPPSGAGNCVCLVIGKDKTQTVRIVGGNYFHKIKMPAKPYVPGHHFFSEYESGDCQSRREQVRQTTANWLWTLPKLSREKLGMTCEFANAMPIYISVLDDETGQCLFGLGPALLDGLRPADFSYEFMGEVTA